MTTITVKATAPGYGGITPKLRKVGEVFAIEQPAPAKKGERLNKASWYEPVEVPKKTKAEEAKEQAAIELEKLQVECRNKGVDFASDWSADQLKEALGRTE